MGFPVIDLLGLQRRSVVDPSYFDHVEAATPGFVAQQIATHTSGIYSRLRKRYGAMLPFGQAAAFLVSSGLTPPAVVLSGRPTLGSYLITIQITTGGALGAAVFRWSSDGGITWTTGITTATTLTLGSTGITATFPAGTYDTSNVYTAAPPVPETILRWVTILVSFDVLRRHGLNPNDPLATSMVEEVKLVQSEVMEAANSQTGLFDLPFVEDAASAIDTGGVLSYTERSPYVFQDMQGREGREDDERGFGRWSR